MCPRRICTSLGLTQWPTRLNRDEAAGASLGVGRSPLGSPERVLPGLGQLWVDSWAPGRARGGQSWVSANTRDGDEATLMGAAREEAQAVQVEPRADSACPGSGLQPAELGSGPCPVVDRPPLLLSPTQRGYDVATPQWPWG